MSSSKYIPTGRTSLIKKDTVSLQVQTEYAYRPFPRLTTTILNNGQVLHKIEKKLEKEIESVTEQNIIEDRIKSQHLDVIKIIKDNDTSGLLLSKNIIEPNQNEDAAEKENVSVVENAVAAEIKSNSEELKAHDTLEDESDTEDTAHYTQKFKAVAGVKYVYHLSPDGQFHSELESNQFKNTFSSIFKNIVEMMEIFSLMPGGIEREKGVCEIQRNSLYLVSAGEKVYFIVLEKPNKDINYEERFNQIINKYINLSL